MPLSHLRLLEQIDESIAEMVQEAANTTEALGEANEAKVQASCTAFLRHLHAIQSQARQCIADLPETQVPFTYNARHLERRADFDVQRLQFCQDLLQPTPSMPSSTSSSASLLSP
mmetsp:Transcript_4960/g.9047  ORF Transcript_4960/g.9047 Transcript_4960/m.9047 type:complete len:115 (-) Transcript_4960:64-408(-)